MLLSNRCLIFCRPENCEEIVFIHFLLWRFLHVIDIHEQTYKTILNAHKKQQILNLMLKFIDRIHTQKKLDKIATNSKCRFILRHVFKSFRSFYKRCVVKLYTIVLVVKLILTPCHFLYLLLVFVFYSDIVQIIPCVCLLMRLKAT